MSAFKNEVSENYAVEDGLKKKKEKKEAIIILGLLSSSVLSSVVLR